MTIHRIPEPDPELDDVPEELLGNAIEFAMEVRGIPLGGVLDICRKHALRQFRRERRAKMEAAAVAREQVHRLRAVDKEAAADQHEIDDERQWGTLDPWHSLKGQQI